MPRQNDQPSGPGLVQREQLLTICYVDFPVRYSINRRHDSFYWVGPFVCAGRLNFFLQFRSALGREPKAVAKCTGEEIWNTREGL